LHAFLPASPGLALALGRGAAGRLSGAHRGTNAGRLLPRVAAVGAAALCLSAAIVRLATSAEPSRVLVTGLGFTYLPKEEHFLLWHCGT
jgi:hypothetical protein